MFRRFFYFFPVQLLSNHLKNNHLLMCFWLMLFGIITGNLGGSLGLHHLFLSPEYLGRSGFGSFLIVGIALGGFTMAFHSTTCLMDMHKFPFVGILPRPFANFCLNNSVIPLAYLVAYIVSISRFQRIEQQNTLADIAIKNLGLLVGVALISLIMFLYMAIANKDIFSYRARSITSRLKQAFLHRVNRVRRIWFTNKDAFQVTSYLEIPCRISYTKHLDKYYDPAVVAQIFNQNQFHLIFFEVMAVVLLFVLGFWGHHAFSQIPAAASSILFLAILMMFTGLLSFWTRGWASTAVIVFIIFLSTLAKHGMPFGSRESHAFGLRYTSDRADYSLAEVRKVNSREVYLKDRLGTIEILNNWRKKFPAEQAPKLVVVCASGGGQKAALWTLKVLQTADSMTDGKLMQHTMLMSCVSGGALGGSYFRELCLRKNMGEAVDPYAKKHLDKIAYNTLNPVVFNLVTNDILLDINKFRYQDITYRRDRGHALEDQVNKHTDFILEKPLKAYREPELKSIIPMLLLAPTIINDGRKLFISPHNVSYLGTALTEGKLARENGKIKGVDFMHFFRNQGAENLRFLSALRMAATYPYVLPSVSLPSTPVMEVMDAALFDNFGVTDAVCFLYVFRDWIAKHTAGAVLVTIRGGAKEKEGGPGNLKYLFSKPTNPIGTFQSVLHNMQDIRNDNLIELTNTSFANDIAVIEFEYVPPQQKPNKYLQSKKTSLTWHLTAGEKEHIGQSIHTPHNQRALARLKNLLK